MDHCKTAHLQANAMLKKSLPNAEPVGNNVLFKAENARPNTCNMARICLQIGHVNTLDWPSRTPYLSPIEHLWNIPGKRVRDLYPFSAATLPEQ